MVGQKRFEEMNRLLNQKFKEKQTLIAVHRGAWGGSIIENTIPAYKAALDMGGDMFECDVIKSEDGVLYAIHDTYEKRLLHKRKNIKTYPSRVIDKLRYYNGIGKPTDEKVVRLEEVLEYFCHGELMNIDRSWSILPELDGVLRRYPHILQQAVVKTPAKAEYLDFFETCDVKYMYMPICKTLEMVELALSYKNINMVGVELIAGSPDSPLFAKETLEMLKSKGLYVWVNAINLSNLPRHVLSAGFDDTVSVKEGPEKGWGVLMELGFNVLQTDWPAQLREYRDKFHK